MIAVRVWVTPEAETCTCSEAYVEGGTEGQRRLATALLHNCEYIRRRNALIYQARKRARTMVPIGGYGWAIAFLDAMDALVAEARQNGLL